MKTNGYFELRGSANELLPKLRSGKLRQAGVIFFLDFGDGTIKLGTTKNVKARIRKLQKNTSLHSQGAANSFGVSPIISDPETVKKTIFQKLSAFKVGKDLFSISQQQLNSIAERTEFDVIRSCMWPACSGYFNHRKKTSTKPLTANQENVTLHQKKIHQLSVISSRIKDIINEKTGGKRFWMKAEVISAHLNTDGNTYFDVVEMEDRRQVAKIRGIIWKRDRVRIEQEFSQAGIEFKLDNGAEITIECTVDYNPVFGLFVNVVDAAPNFAPGEIAASRISF